MATTLERGSAGPEVRALQQRLNERGASPPLAVDGEFGPRTEAAVVAFQTAHGLQPDGVVGPLTRAALGLAEPAGNDDARILAAMELLVSAHSFPVEGAAGLVGNLWAESGVLPNRIEGSRPSTPMRAEDFAGRIVDFTPAEVMNRNRDARVGPLLPGVGLAQWTSPARRAGLFRHVFQGAALGAAVLESMAAQVDYLATELRQSFPGVDAIARRSSVTAGEASDEVAYRFEAPGVVLDEHGHLLPRDDGRVQQLFTARRTHAQRALRVFRSAHA